MKIEVLASTKIEGSLLKNKKSNLIWFSLVVLFYFSLTAIDFTVHSTLYKYGLIFDYAWANYYWIALSLVVASTSCLITVTHYMGTHQAVTSIKYGLTLLLLSLAGTIDWIFYMFYNRGVYMGEWTWMPQYHLFGTWNATLQLIQTIIVFASIIAMWDFVEHKPSEETKPKVRRKKKRRVKLKERKKKLGSSPHRNEEVLEALKNLIDEMEL